MTQVKTSASIEVTPFDGDASAWDRYLDAAPGPVFFQRSAWRRVLRDEFGFDSCDLVARRQAAIVGVVPLCELPLGRGRRCLLSQPFAVEAGICADDDDVAEALATASISHAAMRGASYVELRDSRRGGGYTPRSLDAAIFRAPLPDDEEDHWRSLPGRRRNMLRKARKCGLSVHIGFDDLDAFYDLHARSLRRLGTPVFAPSYVRRLVDSFAAESALLTIRHHGMPVASVLSFFFRGVVLPYYVGNRPEATALAANDLLYWELMRLARLRGAQVFDFGRSRANSGAWAYKQFWGFHPQPLHYRWHGVDGPLPAPGALEAAPLALLRRAWSHVPLALTKRLGPPLMRRFGARYT